MPRLIVIVIAVMALAASVERASAQTASRVIRLIDQRCANCHRTTNADRPPVLVEKVGESEILFGGAADQGAAYFDQRSRAVANGIWQVGRGFQISGLHIWGSGERSNTSYGGDLRNLRAGGSARLRPDGTIVPRNSFVQPDTNRTDVRFQQRIPFGDRVAIDAIAEVFNTFNRPNWNVETEESARDFGERVSGQNRTMQFGFRLTF